MTRQERARREAAITAALVPFVSCAQKHVERATATRSSEAVAHLLMARAAITEAINAARLVGGSQS